MSMTRLKTVVSAAVAFLAVAAGCYAQLSDRDLVENAYPPDLLIDRQRGSSAVLPVDLNHDGDPLLVAVYSAGGIGAVKVLNRAGQVVAEPSRAGLRGYNGRARAVDIDGDGTPEIVVSFSSGRSPDNADSWIYRWSGGRLDLISPLCSAGDVRMTCFNDVYFVDLTGTGKLSVLSSAAYERRNGDIIQTEDWSLYSLVNGTLTRTPQTFVYAGFLSRGKKAPTSATLTFDSPPGAAVLRVINGVGDEAVTSGHVALNGREVLGAADFKKASHVLEAPVALQAQNVIEARLDGKPGAKITVLVTTPTH